MTLFGQMTGNRFGVGGGSSEEGGGGVEVENDVTSLNVCLPQAIQVAAAKVWF